MSLQESQGRSSKLSKIRCRINIPVVAGEYEWNIQPISQCYAGSNTRNGDVKQEQALVINILNIT